MDDHADKNGNAIIKLPQQITRKQDIGLY